MDSLSHVEPPRVAASAVYKRKGRWYVRLACPECKAQLRVRLSLGPMVAHCERCEADAEADVGGVLVAGSA